jgi:hypothetical protein
VNDSDSDNGSFSELSNSETYEANSPFSSSSSKEAEEEIVQPEPEAGREQAGPFLNVQIQIWSYDG